LAGGRPVIGRSSKPRYVTLVIKAEGTMVKKITPNGKRIKELRTNHAIEFPQLRFAHSCNISERTLRRIENENLAVPAPLLLKIAKTLRTFIEDITLNLSDSKATLQPDESTMLTSTTPNKEKVIFITRYTNIILGPISTQRLCELAEICPDIIPHILVDAPPAQMAMIKEYLELLKAISDRKGSFDEAAIADVHDDADFPEVSRRGRLTWKHIAVPPP
jgi:DNA-binding XRE family transcriptional regulator